MTLLFSDLFGSLDPFGSSSFSSSSTNSSTGFADFSHMSKPRDSFEGRTSWLPDYQKVLAQVESETIKCDTKAPVFIVSEHTDMLSVVQQSPFLQLFPFRSVSGHSPL